MLLYFASENSSDSTGGVLNRQVKMKNALAVARVLSWSAVEDLADAEHSSAVVKAPSFF